MKTRALPAYIQIEQDLREKILRGKLGKGERLTEEKLSSLYGVSRVTLRKSLSILSSEGYISQVPGRGTFVTSPQDNFMSRASRFKSINNGIGILVPCVTFSIYPGIIRGAEDCLRKAGYHISLASYDVNPEVEGERMEMFAARGISGLIIAASFNSHMNKYYKTLAGRKIPFVLADSSVAGVKADIIQTDNIKGGYLGTKYLIDAGCRKIAFISGTFKAEGSRERCWGYREALELEGITADEGLIKADGFSEDFGHETAKNLFRERKIDGIFSANEPITAGVLKAVKEEGIAVPEELKIASFDEPDLPRNLNYPMALVRQPRYEIGKIAAKILLDRIKEKGARNELPARKILLEPELHA